LSANAGTAGAESLKYFPPIQAQLQADALNDNNVRQQLQQCWQQFVKTELYSRDGTRFCLYSRTSLPGWRKPHAALLIVPGRIEAAHKYAELAQDALCSGYQVFVIDHRGQGLAQRPEPDPQLGDVTDFRRYSDDLMQAVSTVRSQTDLPLLALAHSMGSAILYRYLQMTALPLLDAAIFCAPMFGIPTGPLPRLSRFVAMLMQQLNQRFSRAGWYVPGQGPYQNLPFADNALTLSEERYQWFRDLYQQYPAYQLGGVSWRWLHHALEACTQIQQGVIPAVPMLILQAGADTVVDNQAQNKLAARCAIELHQIADARHELLAGTDAQRQQVFSLINLWLQRVATGPGE
jgi:lysophospholipase